MVSGMDTDSLVNSLMQIEQLKIDKLYRSKTLIEWKNESLRDVNNTIREFRDKYMSVLSPDTNMYSSAVYKAYDVDMVPDSSIKVTAGGNAVAGNYVIDNITCIAESAKALSEGGITGGQGLNTSVALKDLSLITPMEFIDGAISFRINNVEFTFSESDSLQKVMNTVNNSEANVNMQYSSLSDSFTLSTKNTGSSAELTVENILGNIFGVDSALGIHTGTFTGADAKLQINGYDVIKQSNTFTIDGIEYNLRGTLDTPVHFNVSRNIEPTVNKIKDFIGGYNKLIEDLNERIYETKSYNYQPLTDIQKKDMSEDEIANWETEARKGLLRNDFGISTLLSELRGSVYQKVEGLNLSLFDIGITTGSYKGRGKLVIDEQKLRSAIQNNPDNVMKLFTVNSDSKDNTTKYAESGFIPRMLSSFTRYNGRVDFTELSEQISEYNKRMESMEIEMYRKSERVYRQFAAMESALAEMNSQSAWIAQQMGAV
ncbi:MAG TPA: hypothetical protein DDZ89_14520 [Clostridiales bacterium]|nr:hypothetical protein [Clostridiales bacterium]